MDRYRAVPDSEVIQVPFDLHEVLALAAPRRLLLSTSDNDFVFPMRDRARKAVIRLQAVYTALGGSRRISRRSTSAPVIGCHRSDCGADVRDWLERDVEPGMTLLLAIDGGGTRTDASRSTVTAVSGAGGSPGPSNHLHVAMDDGHRCAADRDRRGVCRRSVRPDGRRRARLGRSRRRGCRWNGRRRGAGMCERSIGFNRVAVYGDMVIAHRGALAGEAWRHGAGRHGSSMLGIGNDGTMIKAGGWGPLYGRTGEAPTRLAGSVSPRRPKRPRRKWTQDGAPR